MWLTSLAEGEWKSLTPSYHVGLFYKKTIGFSHSREAWSPGYLYGKSACSWSSSHFLCLYFFLSRHRANYRWFCVGEGMCLKYMDVFSVEGGGVLWGVNYRIVEVSWLKKRRPQIILRLKTILGKLQDHRISPEPLGSDLRKRTNRMPAMAQS